MPYLMNGLYLLGLILVSPWLVWKWLTTSKYRRGLLTKFMGLVPTLSTHPHRVWFHAVSVGEVLLLKPVLTRIRMYRPDWECVVSVTTQSGMEVATKTYPDLKVFYFPFDFSWAIRRALKRIQPRMIVLAELELWPNLISLAHRRGVKLALMNGRLSERSFKGYKRIRFLVKHWLAKLHLIAMQNQVYADRILALGAPANRVHVTGSVKFDGVYGDRENFKTMQLARQLGLEEIEGERKPLIFIAGSTQEPEEQLALDIYKRAKPIFPELRLILVPRHPERFDAVAKLIHQAGLPLQRRSQVMPGLSFDEAVILVDTMGELNAVWGLADVAFVGGSLCDRGGQNMIEPAAYGASVLFGPNVWNFQDVVDRLLENQAAIQVQNGLELETQVLRLLGDETSRHDLGIKASQFVLSQHGAADRTLYLLQSLFTPQSWFYKAA